MGRRSHQLDLPIGTIEPPEHLLRKAHQESRVPKAFDEAMSLTHFRIGLRHMAMLMAGKGKKKR